MRAESYFCDDVRLEVGGKLTIVGLYRGFIAVAAGAPPLPKFVAMLAVDYARSDVGQRLVVQLLNGAQVVQRIEHPLEETPVAPELLQTGEVMDQLSTTAVLEFVQFAPPHGARLRLVAEAENGFRFEGPELIVLRLGASSQPPGTPKPSASA